MLKPEENVYNCAVHCRQPGTFMFHSSEYDAFRCNSQTAQYAKLAILQVLKLQGLDKKLI